MCVPNFEALPKIWYVVPKLSARIRHSFRCGDGFSNLVQRFPHRQDQTRWRDYTIVKPSSNLASELLSPDPQLSCEKCRVHSLPDLWMRILWDGVQYKV